MYQEGPESTFTHNGARFSVDKLLELTAGRAFTFFPLEDLAWQLDSKEGDIDRIGRANFTIPIIVCTFEHWGQYKHVIVDGWHRAKKKRIIGSRIIRTIMITPAELGEAFIGFYDIQL